ncbi:MAG: DMT family transporter [Spirochaetales bacterium]|nr:DMT family transporter [Spirochaetales bacterium]
MGIIYALLSALSYGTADFLGGFSSRKNSALLVVALSQAMGLLTALAAVYFLRPEYLVPSDFLWGIAAGIAGASGVGLLYHGLATGFASIVSPTAAVVGAALPVLFGLIAGERPPLMTWAGVAVAIPAILLLSWDKGEKRDHILKSLELGVLSGIAFSGFFIFIARTGEGSGMVPLLAARSITVPLFITIALIKKQRLVPRKGTLITILAGGCLDMLANVFYLLSTRTGFLIIAVILTSLYPAPTVFLQRFFIKEKLSVARLAGLALAIAGAALIGIRG